MHQCRIGCRVLACSRHGQSVRINGQVKHSGTNRASGLLANAWGRHRFYVRLRTLRALLVIVRLVPAHVIAGVSCCVPFAGIFAATVAGTVHAGGDCHGNGHPTGSGERPADGTLTHCLYRHESVSLPVLEPAISSQVDDLFQQQVMASDWHVPQRLQHPFQFNPHVDASPYLSSAVSAARTPAAISAHRACAGFLSPPALRDMFRTAPMSLGGVDGGDLFQIIWSAPVRVCTHYKPGGAECGVRGLVTVGGEVVGWA